jgi:uncharacterized protein (TIGR02996 family)
MTDGDALYRAIMDAPDDDAPRLVWADWLDEHGDPDRAAFVRLQCQWAALDPGDPRMDQLWERWSGLLERNRDRWTAGLGDYARNCRFWRGLPDWFDVVTGQLSDQVAELRRQVPAQCLNLHLTALPEGLRYWPGLDSVRCLDIIEPAPDPFYPGSSLRGWVWLLQSPRLRGLRSLQVEMDLTSVGVLSAIAAADWPHLRELSVRVPNAESEKPPAAWADMPEANWFPGLRALDLWGCYLGDGGIASLLSTRRALELTRLNLGLNGLSPAAFRFLVASPALRNLRSIELSGNPVGESVGELLRSPALPHVCSLVASAVVGPGHSGRDLVAAIAEADPGRLRVLELHSNTLDVEAVQTLVESRAVEGLEVLSLNGNDLPDEAAEAIADSPRLRNLRRLELAANRLTDAALEALARSPHLQSLRTLAIRGNTLSTDGLLDFQATDLARHLWRLDTEFADPPRKRQWFETV